MSDCSKSTVPVPPESHGPVAPPAYADDAGWRQVFLYELRCSDREALRRLSEVIMELARESRLLDRGAGAVVPALRAAIEDLVHLQSFFGFLSEFRRTAELDEQEWRLAERAERWAEQLGSLAAGIESSLPEVRQ